MARTDSARISPTAHYTAYVWFANGLSHPALATPLGRFMHAAIAPPQRLYDALAPRPSLDAMLLARHRAMDAILSRQIESGRIAQVIEIAGGLSPRGFTLARRHPALRYVEADLPAMADEKRRRLDRAGLRGDNHLVISLDALADAGPLSLSVIAREVLDPARGTALVTEGLLNYFDRATVEAMWRRFAGVLSGFPAALYLSDLNLAGDVRDMRLMPLFLAGLGLFARGQVHLHYQSEREAREALAAAGFPGATVQPASPHATVRIVEANTVEVRAPQRPG